MNNFSILSFNKRKRQINKKQNRDLIITAARKLFAERGFDNASIRQIILEANLGSGTFYNYFDNKEKVFLVIINRVISEFSTFILAKIDRAKSFEELVNIAFTSWFDWISSEEENYIFFKNNKKYILDLKWLSSNSSEYQIFNKKLLDVAIKMSNIIKFPQNDISLMVTSVIAVSVSLGDELLERSEISSIEASKFATKLFLKGL